MSSNAPAPSTASEATASAKNSTLFARQPILDAERNLVAYELLFRGDFENTAGEAASAMVMLNAFDQGTLRGGQPGVPVFVNFTQELLFNFPPFDPESVVIELLENIVPSPKVVEQVRAIKSMGYQIALDDFVDSEAMDPLLALADIVKVDVLETPAQDLPALLDRLRSFKVRLLAEKVEDYESFHRCSTLGFELYQGYFFAKPEPVTGRAIGPNKASVLAMIAALQDPDIDQETLENIIASDSGLTYKVMRLSNSAAVRRAVPINSVGKAIAMLGMRRLQNFATLISLSEIGQKPPELQIYARHRALLCEHLGRAAQAGSPVELYQLAGILSCCDAYFDAPLEDLIPKLPIEETLEAGLLHRTGSIGAILQAATAFQENRWDDIDWPALEALGISQKAALESVREVSSWAEPSGDVELW